MNKSILSVLITNTLIAPNVVAEILAADESAPEQNLFSSLVNGTGGYVGAFFEQEDKKVYDRNGKLVGTNLYTENSIITGYLYNRELPISLNYSIKQILNKWQPANGNFIQIDDGYQLQTNLRYRTDLGQSFSTGLGWKTKIERSERSKSNETGDLTKDQHQFYTFLGYWNKDWKGGFYSELNYGLQNDFNELSLGAWGDKDTTYYKFTIKPYKNFGKFFAGVEFYYEDKDTESKRTSIFLENFKEMYVEPELAYSFDFGGRLFVKQRITQKTTTQANGNEYFGNVNKTTLGYQQNLKNWLIGAEVELFNEDKEENIGAGRVDSGNEEYNKIKLLAQYRF
ncbi:hypothetical protein ACP3V5_17985 [Vibrio maritimus]